MEERVFNQRYEENVDGKGRKFFIYAPPLKGVRPSKRMPPNPPYRNAEPYKVSVYYYWWAYLRRSKLYKRTCENSGKGKLAKLYADFGNIWDDKGSELDTFWHWWTNHSHLFCEPTSRKLEEVTVLDTQTSHSEMIIRVPLEMRAAYLVRQFRKLLTENKQRVEQAREQSRALYPVQAKVPLKSLHEHLTVFDAINEHKDLKLHQIAELEHIKQNVMVNDAVLIDEGYYLRLSNMDPKDSFYKYVSDIVTRRKKQAMYRHKRACEQYIANIEKGLFPLR